VGSAAFWGYWIESTPVQWMTPQQASESHNAAAHYAVFRNCNGGVLGTGRLEAASALRAGDGMKQGRNRALIEGEQSARSRSFQV
jgi:hypothetical protein